MPPPDNGKPSNRAGRRLAAREAELLRRCLAGCEAAWREFFRARTPELDRWVRHFLGAAGQNAEAVDEVVARIWHALLRDDKRILRRYSPERHTGLDRYLAGVARYVVRRYLRAERLRRRYESVGGRRTHLEFTPSGLETGTLLNEFATTLNPDEVQFLEAYLLSSSDGDANGGDGLSPTAVWQRRYRLRCKLERFLGEEG